MHFQGPSTVHLRSPHPCSSALTCGHGCSACPGDTSVCLGKVGLLGADWTDREVTQLGPSVKGKKNLYTNPGKRGGMGFAFTDRTIGRNPPAYMPDTYQHGREIGKQLRRRARERIPKPFNSSPNTGSGLFTRNPYHAPPGPAHATAPAPAARKEGDAAAKKAFAPSNPSRKGAAYCTLSKVGRNYVPQPPDEKQVRALPELTSQSPERGPALMARTCAASGGGRGCAQGAAVQTVRGHQGPAVDAYREPVPVRCAATPRHGFHPAGLVAWSRGALVCWRDLFPGCFEGRRGACWQQMVCVMLWSPGCTFGGYCDRRFRDRGLPGLLVAWMPSLQVTPAPVSYTHLTLPTKA